MCEVSGPWARALVDHAFIEYGEWLPECLGLGWVRCLISRTVPVRLLIGSVRDLGSVWLYPRREKLALAWMRRIGHGQFRRPPPNMQRWHVRAAKRKVVGDQLPV